MTGISKLYCGTVTSSDPLRYGRSAERLPGELLQFSADKKPVVVWNCTRRCNLRCLHCYSASDSRAGLEELSTAEAMAMIDDLAESAAVLLFSGGEPLLRPDLVELIARARTRGLPTVLSSNGTGLTAERAGELAGAGLRYIGISLDGATAATNDRFRGRAGAFEAAMAGVRNCLAEGMKVGLRFTMTSHNIAELPGIFELIQRENIPRVCFYHLVAAGRGGELIDGELTSLQTRRAVDVILAQTRTLHEAGLKVEVLTVGNHADGPYLYTRLLAQDRARAADVYKLLQFNGGNSSGEGIGCVSWDGCVHPDQFWRGQVVGNVRTEPFSRIWTGEHSQLLRQLRRRKELLQGRCRRCRFLDVCNGNLRARAQATGRGLWGHDPGCYLSDEEIGI